MSSTVSSVAVAPLVLLFYDVELRGMEYLDAKSMPSSPLWDDAIFIMASAFTRAYAALASTVASEAIMIIDIYDSHNAATAPIIVLPPLSTCSDALSATALAVICFG